jgi:hypothetical protein
MARRSDTEMGVDVDAASFDLIKSKEESTRLSAGFQRVGGRKLGM